MSALPNNFANVTVNLPPVGVSPQSFNLGLIMGNSTVISTGTRVATYASLAAMATAGFSLSSPEYLAATAYFSQTPAPTQVMIGRRGTGETCLAAIQAARLASSAWYAVYDTSAGDSDQAATAAWIEAQSAPFAQYFMNTSTAAVKNGTGGNIFATAFAALYKRTQGTFSSALYIGAASLGLLVGRASNLANSSFTYKFKKLGGITPDVLTTAQVATIEGYNGNVYITRTGDGFENGTNFSGNWTDEILGLDMLSSTIQANIANVLYQNDSVPQTEVGMAMLKSAVAQACESSAIRGFLARGGIWNGVPILTLNTGDTMPNGYVILSEPIANQNQTDRNNRIAPNIYACVKLAGSMHSMTVAVNVNR